MKKVLFFFILFSLILSGCKKPDTNGNTIPTLPDATQSGKNTFGCKVDGAIYTPQASKYVFGPNVPLGCDYNTNSGFVHLGTKRGDEETMLGFSNKHIFSTGSYSFSNTDSNSAGYIHKSERYFSDSLPNGSLVITKIDTVLKIISGTFVYNATDPITQKTIHITEGRFDMKYPYPK